MANQELLFYVEKIEREAPLTSDTARRLLSISDNYERDSFLIIELSSVGIGEEFLLTLLKNNNSIKPNSSYVNRNDKHK